MSSPLTNKRVLNTRALHQAGPLDELLRAEGAIPVSFPCIGIEPLSDTTDLDRAVRDLLDGRFGWLILTSTNTADITGERLRVLGRPVIEQRAFRVAAVGKATAAAVERWLAQPVDFVPGEQHAIALAAALPIEPGERVLIPASSKASPELAAALHRRGAVVDTIAAYQTVQTVPDIDLGQLLIDRRIDAIAFASPSAVEGFTDQLQQAGLKPAILAELVVACIGPSTERAAEARQIPFPIMSREHDLAGLVKTLRNAFATRTRREASHKR